LPNPNDSAIIEANNKDTPRCFNIRGNVLTEVSGSGERSIARFRAVRISGRLCYLWEATMNLTISLGLADAEMVKFLSALESGKMRTPFNSEVIHFKILNEHYEKKGLPIIPPLYLQGSLFIKFGIVSDRKEIGNDLIRFTLDHPFYGNLGVLWLKTAGDTRSDLDYETPPLPSEEEARKLLKNFPKRNGFLTEISDDVLEFGLRTETFEPARLHVRRSNLQQEILKAYLELIRISLGATIHTGWDASTREFMVHLTLRDALTEVESFIKDYEGNGRCCINDESW
jgi:hypothetical protein